MPSFHFRTNQEEMKQSNRTYFVIDESLLLPNNSSEISGNYFDKVIIDGTVHNYLKTTVCLSILGVIILICLIVTLGRSLLYYKLAMMSSFNLHRDMFHSLLRASMHFFNNNPGGRILNRFSRDLGAVDELLPALLLDALQVSLSIYIIYVKTNASQNKQVDRNIYETSDFKRTVEKIKSN